MTEHTKHTTFADIFKLFEHLTSDDAEKMQAPSCSMPSGSLSNIASELSRMTTSAVRSTIARSILYLDATYIKIRESGIVHDWAVLIAVGVDSETGRRRIIGVSVFLSEAEEHWSDFFKSLMARGMNRPTLVVSDSHVGIRGAVAKTLTGVPWQRCQFHFQQNAQSYVTGKRLKSFVAGEIRAILLPWHIKIIVI